MLILASCAFAFTGCESVPVGPSLSNVRVVGFNNSAIDTPAGWKVAQLPTIPNVSGTALDPTVCCCHVRATVTNSNSVPIHAIVLFAAMDQSNQEQARIIDFAQDLQPGASYRIPDNGPGAAGFLLSCSQIDHVNYEIRVSSLAQPIL